MTLVGSAPGAVADHIAGLPETVAAFVIGLPPAENTVAQALAATVGDRLVVTDTGPLGRVRRRGPSSPPTAHTAPPPRAGDRRFSTAITAPLLPAVLRDPGLGTFHRIRSGEVSTLDLFSIPGTTRWWSISPAGPRREAS
ncbi:hypothetical protein ACWEQ0_16850 [Nocardia thailandica]